MGALGAPPCVGCGQLTYSSCQTCHEWVCGRCLLTHECMPPKASRLDTETNGERLRAPDGG